MMSRDEVLCEQNDGGRSGVRDSESANRHHHDDSRDDSVRFLLTKH